MPRNAYHRSKAELLRDRAEVAQLYLRGRTQHEIADHMEQNRSYKYGRTKVQNDIKRIRQKWEESALMDFHKKRAEELAKIDALEREYWEAYMESKEPRQEHKVEGQPAETDPHTNGEASHTSIQPTKIERTTKEPVAGNPQFLKGIQWCIDKRCEILGLDAPERTMTLNIDWESLTDEQLDRIASGENVHEVVSDQEVRQLQGR